MKNKILIFIVFVFFCACSHRKFNENQIKNLRATLSYLDMTNETISRNTENIQHNIEYHHRNNPYKAQLEIDIKNFREFTVKDIGFIYKYQQELNKKTDEAQEQTNYYNNLFQKKTPITQEKSDKIVNMLITHLEDLQKKFNHLRTDTLFKGFLKKENKQEFFYQYYFENTSVIESLISLEEIVFVLLQYQQECLYAISQKYLEKGNLTRIEILNKKEKYQVGDTILLGLKGNISEIINVRKPKSTIFHFNEFPKNTWYHIIPKDSHIGKNDLYTNVRCMRENQQDTAFFRNLSFEVAKK